MQTREVAGSLARQANDSRSQGFTAAKSTVVCSPVWQEGVVVELAHELGHRRGKLIPNHPGDDGADHHYGRDGYGRPELAEKCREGEGHALETTEAGEHAQEGV